MSNQQETLLQQTNELLEAAQKEVLKEINNQKTFLARLFSKNNIETLKQAQSSISKAINQMKNFTKDESTLIVKLQNHLNEKSNLIKQLEEKNLNSDKEISDLKDRVKFFEQEALKASSIKVEASPNTSTNNAISEHKLEEGLKAKIKELEDHNHSVKTQFTLTKESLEKSQALSVELSKRMKRLKAEITSK